MAKPKEHFIDRISFLEGSSKTPTADGYINVNSAVFQNVSGITHIGRNITPFTSSGEGSFWVKNGIPSEPVFTDSSGRDWGLGGRFYNPLATAQILIQAPDVLPDSYVLKLPSTNGTFGQALVNDGTGTLFWSESGGGAQSLTEVLAYGNTTDGYDIIISLNDNITSPENINLIPDGYTRIQSNLNVDGYIDVGVDSDINLGDGAVNIYDAEYIAFYNLDNSNRIMIRSPDNATSYILNLPENSGISGQILSTDGSGILSWIDPGIGAQSFSNVLSYGNNTDGYDIILSNGQWLKSSINTEDVLITGIENQILFLGNVNNDGYLGLASQSNIYVYIGNISEVINISSDNTTFNHDVIIDGKLNVTGLIDPTGMVFVNQLSVPSGLPSVNQVTIWTDANSNLNITDSFGNNTVVTNTSTLSTDIPVLLNDPNEGELIVLVNTSSVNWTNEDLITLPDVHTDGSRIVIKDSGGQSFSKNIIISGNGSEIDGANTSIISTNYGNLKLVSDGTNWFII